MDQVQSSSFGFEEDGRFEGHSDRAEDKVQACEVSSTSLYIRRNFSLYQQLTKADKKAWMPPASPLEKRWIQEKWSKFPSPFPSKKHNLNQGKAVGELQDKIWSVGGCMSPPKPKTTVLKNPKKRGVTTDTLPSLTAMQKWLATAPPPQPHPPENERNKINTAVESRDFGQGKYGCCSSDHIVQEDLRGRRQDSALQLKVDYVLKEVKELQSVVEKLRVVNEKILSENECLQTLNEIRSIKNCADIGQTAIADLLSKTLLCRPGDMDRYKETAKRPNINGYGSILGTAKFQTCEHGDQFKSGAFKTRRTVTDQDKAFLWGRRLSERSIKSLETELVDDWEDSMSRSSSISSSSSTISTISINAIDEADSPYGPSFYGKFPEER